MVHDRLRQMALRLLADCDARSPGHSFARPVEPTVAQAYELQGEVARLREQRGEKVVGYKVGCTSRPIQLQFSVQEPIFGRLWGTECHPSGAHLSSARYANLAVEGEMAVRLSRDLPSEPLSAQECRKAIAEVFPVIELHHYVVPGAWPAGQWLIASNAMHAGFVLAEAVTRCSGLANFAHSASIRINEVVVGAVADAASLSLPIESLRWLAGRLTQFGLRLCKGQVILTGSPMKLYPVAPGSRFRLVSRYYGAGYHTEEMHRSQAGAILARPVRDKGTLGVGRCVRGQQVLQDLRVDRLEQVQIAAGFQGAQAIFRRAEARHGYQQRACLGRALTNALGDLEAIHARHGDVQQDDVGLESRDGFEGGGTIVRHAGFVAPQPQQQGRGRTHVLRVIDHQDTQRADRRSPLHGIPRFTTLRCRWR
jgi:2-keto-4-pentenoate hydratase